MNLVARCLERGWNRVAFIGVTKHAGKTTALNGMIAQAEELGIPLGICSIGLDGERLDTILGVEKPAIYAPAGTLVVSAEKALEQSDATFEWLDSLPIESPLGTILLVRVTSPGHVVLAGVRQRAHVKMTIPILQAYGAELCFVDGAFDRIAAAAPSLVDAAVLAVGASAGKTVSDVVNYTYPLIQRFRLPVYDAEHRAEIQGAHEHQTIGLLTPDGLVEIGAHESLYGLVRHTRWSQDVHTVYLPGALTDEIANDLRQAAQSLHLVVSHPAQVMLGTDALRRWFQLGNNLSVWDSMPLVGIAANPHSMRGNDLSGHALQAALRGIAPDIPVYDAMSEGGVNDDGSSLIHG